MTLSGGEKVTCAECGHDAFNESRMLEAFPEQSMVKSGRVVWACTRCGAVVDLGPWMRGKLP